MGFFWNQSAHFKPIKAVGIDSQLFPIQKNSIRYEMLNSDVQISRTYIRRTAHSHIQLLRCSSQSGVQLNHTESS